MWRITTIAILFTLSLFNCSKTNSDSPKKKEKLIVVNKPTEDEVIPLFNENLVKITNARKVKQLKDSILFAQREKELKKLQNKSLTERYKLGDTTVINKIITLFKGSKEEDIKTALNDLRRSYNAKSGYAIKESNLQEAIFSLLSDKRYAFEVIQLAGVLKIKGYIELFEQETFKDNHPFSGRCFYWLARNGAVSDSVLMHVKSLILNNGDPKKTQNDYFLGLKECMKRGKQNLQKEVGAFAIDLFNKELISMDELIQSVNQGVSSDPGINVSYCVINSHLKNSAPLLNKFLTHNIFEEESLAALVKLNGAKESIRIKNYITDSLKFDSALKAAKILNDSLGAVSNLPELVLRSFGKIKVNSPERIDKVIEVIMEMNAESWLSNLDSLIPSGQLRNDILYAFQLVKNDPLDVASELFALSISKRPYTTSEIAKARKCENYFGEKAYIYKMLHYSGLYLSLDSIISYESIIPTLHYICANSDSILVNSITGVKLNKDSSYSLTFIFNNKAYIYNHSSLNITQSELLTIINNILLDNKFRRKFLIISKEFEATQYLFGKENDVSAFKETFMSEEKDLNSFLN